MKSKKQLKTFLFTIIGFSFFTRVAAFLYLPDTHSSLAPDEGTYASLTKWIAESKPADEFPIFSGGVYRSGRAVILPSSLLYRLGIDELDAVRLVSSAYAVASLILVCMFVYFRFEQKLEYGRDSGLSFNLKINLLLISLFAFLPSHYLWSILGLRESANEFWLICTYISLFFALNSKTYKRHIGVIGVFLSTVLVFSSRVQVGWVLVVAITFYLLFSLNRLSTYPVLVAVIVATIVGFALNSSNTEIPNSNSVTGAVVGKSENLLGKIVGEVAGEVKGIPTKQKDNQFGAASVIQPPKCQWEEVPNFGKYICIVYRSPYSSLTFLFRPIPLVDTTSSTSAAAALENVIWILGFGFVLFGVTRARKEIMGLRSYLPSVIFLVLYVVGAGSYEGNMGTAFRHKSLILWIFLLLISALFYRDSQEKYNDKGDNPEKARFN
jgi:hypothetical protein